jgi:hypothetical protein
VASDKELSDYCAGANPLICRAQGCLFGLHRLGDDLLEGYFRLPIQQTFGFGGIAHQMARISRPEKFGIATDVLLPTQARDLRGNFHNFLHAVKPPGGKGKILGGVVLQRQPHSAHVITGVPPIALRARVAQHKFLLFSGLDRGGGATDFPGCSTTAWGSVFVAGSDWVGESSGWFSL